MEVGGVEVGCRRGGGRACSTGLLLGSGVTGPFDLCVDDSHHESLRFEGNGAASNGTLGDWRVEASFRWSDEAAL